MAKVEHSCWNEKGITDGLTYPECPFMSEWNEINKDGKCLAPYHGKCWAGYFCGTRQHVSGNNCPFDGDEEEIED